jgi:hypothetical protein
LLAASLRAGCEWARPHLAQFGKRMLAEILQSGQYQSRPAGSPPPTESETSPPAGKP